MQEPAFERALCAIVPGGERDVKAELRYPASARSSVLHERGEIMASSRRRFIGGLVGAGVAVAVGAKVAGSLGSRGVAIPVRHVEEIARHVREKRNELDQLILDDMLESSARQIDDWFMNHGVQGNGHENRMALETRRAVIAMDRAALGA